MVQRERLPCDLVMKGGITSGVVYPGAIAKLAETRRFRSLGGASAGAIAAAVAAAGEYGRQSQGTDELPGLDDVAQQLAQPGFLLSLLPPAPGAKRAFHVLIAAVGKRGSGKRRGGRVLTALVRARPEPIAAAALIWVGLLVLAIAGGWAGGVAGVLLGVASAVAITAVLAAAGLGAAAFLVWRELKASLEADENGFGICPGMELAIWLHERIQACAGRTPHDPPLTFRDLEQQEVRLEVMTTDLGYARPVRLPLEDEQTYMFDPKDMGQRFPEAVVKALGAEGEQSQYLPGKDLPIVVAVRMSLSFPLLLSAVRLLSQHPQRAGVMENWFSDGGISSNFPIHFFDSWLPGHPTFGLDLQPFPDEKGAPEVFMPSRPDEQPLPHWTGVTTVGRFIKQIADVMENWRDTMQSELPGFRDRICQVRLNEGEGKLNLDMDPEVVERLIARGRLAAEEIEAKFDPAQHRFTRYLTFMEMMELGLKTAEKRFAELSEELAEGAPGVDVYREGHDGDWCKLARAETNDLFAVARGWGEPPAPVGFDRGYEPTPTPAMRITPKA